VHEPVGQFGASGSQTTLEPTMYPLGQTLSHSTEALPGRLTSQQYCPAGQSFGPSQATLIGVPFVQWPQVPVFVVKS
jgi:hypothetical protein